MGLQIVLMALNACLEGGLQKFQEDGGIISFVPTETPIMLMYAPSITIAEKNKVMGLCTKMGLSVLFVKSLLEQPDQDTFDIAESNEAIKAMCEELKIPEIAFHADSLHIGVSVRGEITPAQSAALSDGINKIIPWATRIFVISENQHTHKEYAPVMTAQKATMREVPQRTTVINEDDILNLQIALGSAKSLEEFLACV